LLARLTTTRYFAHERLRCRQPRWAAAKMGPDWMGDGLVPVSKQMRQAFIIMSRTNF